MKAFETKAFEENFLISFVKTIVVSFAVSFRRIQNWHSNTSRLTFRGGLILSIFFFICLHSDAAVISSTSTGGNWNAGTSWVGGIVPGSADDVTIVAGSSITITAAANAKSLTLGGNLNVNFNLTIANAGSITMATGSAVVFNATGKINGGGNNANGITMLINSGVTLSTSNTAGFNFVTGNVAATGSIAIKPGSHTMTYSSGINYVYKGTANQAVGTGLTQNTPDNLTISNTGAAGSNNVSLAATTNITGDLTVTSGTLSLSANPITTDGNLVVNGAISGTAAITLSGITKTLDGTGSITSTGGVIITAGAKAVASTANLNIASPISVATSVTVTNNGIVNSTNTATGIIGGNATATWINAANSVLNVAGPLLTTGTLTSTSNPNTVNYTGAAQTVKAVSYFNLSLSGSGTAVMTGVSTIGGNFTLSGSVSTTAATAITIAGNITIGSATTFNASTFTHNIGGNWSNGGTFIAGSCNIDFNGTAGQTINGLASTAFYDLTNTNANATGLSLGINTTVSNTLTLSSSSNGIISTGAFILILTKATPLSAISGATFTRYINGNLRVSFPAGNTAALAFPIGTAAIYAPVTLSVYGVSGSVSITASTTTGTSANENIPILNSSGIDATKKCGNYWTLSKIGAGTLTSFDGTFDFTNATQTGTPASYKLRNYSSTWTDVSPVSFPTGTSINASAMTLFGDFECGETNAPPLISVNPSNSTICASASTTFNCTGTAIPVPALKWQRSSNSGATYVDITAALDAGTTYSGFTTPTLALSGSTIALNNYYYRAVYTNINGITNSTAGILTVNANPSTVIVSGGGSFCFNTTITASGGTGGTIYFQGTTSNGTSTATPSTSELITTPGTYYFRSYSGSCWGTQGSATVTFTGFTPGTYAVGPTGNFPSITNALATITACPLTGPYILELQTTYSSAAETFPLTVGQYAGGSSINTITIRPITGAGNLSITSGNTTGTLNLNGATNIIFDGRPGGAGIVKRLSIINTSTTGYAIQLINDASADIFKYCTVKGVNTNATEGVILFSTTTGTTGNDNNTIDNCDIGAGATTPANTIFSLGTAGKGNSFNAITNCAIHDFFQATANSNGVLISTNGDAWTISGNSFYEAATRNITILNSVWTAINLNDKVTGNNTVISGNYIGGQSPLAGGAALKITGTGILRPIRITGGNGTANSIQGNTIANINFTTTSTSVQAIIYHSDGSLNIGNTTPNIIGVATGTASILFTGTAGSTPSISFSPIFLGGATISGIPEATIGGTVNFQNNIIGGITVSSTDSVQLRVIDFEQSLCSYNISANTIGNSTANNIINNTKQSTYGIIALAGGTGITHTISNNTIQNFKVNNTGGTTLPKNQLVGIQVLGDVINATTGVYNISGNIIHDFSSNSKLSNPNGCVIAGINPSSTSPGQVVSANTIYNLIASDAAVSERISGIIFAPASISGSNLVSKNIIRNLKVTSTAGGVVRGIDVSAGPVSVENNMIVLGYDATGASVTNNVEMEGLYNHIGANSFYYNSVHITGTGVASGANNSYAMNSLSTSAKIIKNNLFINSRSNAAGTAKNYGLVISNSTGLTSDYNDIYVSGTGGMFGNNGSDRATISAWRLSTSQDAHSINNVAGFINSATDLHLTGSPSAVNFAINNQGIDVPGVTTDIDGTSRNIYSPDPGCDEYQGTGSWIGGTSTDWATSSNWDDNIVPTSSLDAKILDAPNMPLITTNTESVRDLYITSPGILTINGGILQIAGAIHNNGAFDASAGSVEMTGAAAQTIPANTFVGNALNDLIISNASAGGLSLGGPLDIYNSVAYSGGSMKFNTNDALTLKSTALGTAWIGDVTANTITGKVTVERYISARKAWRLLSIPTNTTQTIKQTWQEGATGTSSDPVPGYGIQITGAAGTTAGFDLYSAAPSMKTYVSASNTWTGVANTSTAGIKATDAYMTFIRGDRSSNLVTSAVTQTVLRTTGALYTGDQTPISVSAGKFACIGNPYASALDMRYITKTGIKDFFYAWDPQLGGTSGYGAYQTFYFNGTDYSIIPGLGSYGASGSVSNYIQSGQGFLVQGDVSGGSLTFKEAAKTTGSSLSSLVQALPKPQFKILLNGLNADNSSYIADGVVIDYDDGYSNLVDDMDAIKSLNASENLAIKNSNTLLVVERRHSIVNSDTVFLNISGMKTQKYRFEFTSAQLARPGLTAFLQDTYLNKSTPLSIEGNTSVDITITSVAASRATNRFTIVFTQPVVLSLTFTSVKASTRNKNIEVEWTTENENNLESYDVEKSPDGNNFVRINTVSANNTALSTYNWLDENVFAGNNYYRISSKDVSGKVAYSKIVKVFTGDKKQTISVCPNPVKDGVINLQFANEDEGVYTTRLLSKSGQLIIIKQIPVAGNTIKSIILDKNISSGIYQMEIVKPGGTKKIINVLISK